MILERVVVGAYAANCYILAEDKNQPAIIIDPGDEPAKIKAVLKRHNLSSAFIINTHGHIDHIGADDAFGACVYIHKEDADFLDDPHLNLSGMFSESLRISAPRRLLEDNDEIKLGRIRLLVLHTPGHSPGGICLWLKEPQNDIIFSGDTLFCQGIGRTDLPRASFEELSHSINNKLFILDNRLRVFPGHGEMTTLGREARRFPV